RLRRLFYFFPPGFAQAVRILLLSGYVQCSDIVGHFHAKSQCALSHPIPSINWNDHHWRPQFSRLQFYRFIDLPRHGLVVGFDSPKQPYQARAHDQRNPGARDEFRNDDDHQRDAGHARPGGVHPQLGSRLFSPLAPPMGHHPKLRERERTECADGKQRDEVVGDAAKSNQEQAGHDGQSDDSVGKNQAPSAFGEKRRHKSIFSKQSADAREIRETGLRRERGDNENGGDSNVVKNSVPGNGTYELRKNGLITRLLLVHRMNFVDWRKIADRKQEGREHNNNYCECPLGSWHFRFLKKRYAVADGLHTGHRSATAG